ncbi:MAG: hypothetical protein KGN34_05975 [Sphingomonadales bacterium]|nr:hypothetical protein [Sphingomonadales bacterium]
MTATRFHHFAAIDWSGAAGERHAGIAVALCEAGHGAPRLVHPHRRWSRPEVLEWLITDLPPHTLVGLDLGISLPFADAGAFFPGWDRTPASARALWALVEEICAADPHFGVTSFIDHRDATRHFRCHGGRQGDLFPPGMGRLRRTEHAQRALGLRPTSNFNLVGAAQVGKSSLSGMRLLHRLPAHLPVWPIDPLPATGSVVTEIYTSLAAIAAGRPAARSKMRNVAELNEALTNLGSAPVPGGGAIADHASDALVTAAWLRRDHARPELWHPPGLSDVAQTEGWTFGAI